MPLVKNTESTIQAFNCLNVWKDKVALKLYERVVT